MNARVSLPSSPGRRARRLLTAVTTLALLAGAVTVTAVTARQARGDTVAAAAASGYTWRNVQIGGGGFVPGIVFNRGEQGLLYARTDIGGAYRWDASSASWTPLLDGIGWDDWGLTGISSIAADPVQTNRVYLAGGTYTNSWDPKNGAVLRSTDRGETWSISRLPFKLGGNMPGRGMGERLAVDPNLDSTLYLAAPSGNGLWRSTDYGATWSQVTSFPNPGNYAEGSDSAGYLDALPGVVWVTFDERSSSAGQATKTIYVGVADLQNTVYRSTDAGATWSRLAGQPTGFIAHKGVLDSSTGMFYIATSDKAGPYEGGHGDVWRYDTATSTWTQVSPIPSSNTSDNYFGYSGLSVDRQHPGTLMVTGYSSWWPDTQIFRSTDSGATWTRIWDWSSYPNRTFRYSLDVSAVPWLTFGKNPSPPEVSPKLGWMTESLEIDPFDSDHMLYGTGATIFGTDNLTAWDADQTVAITPRVKGLEETSVLDLISPPSGAPLLSAIGDIGGFRHDDLDAVPAMMYTQPVFVTTRSIDYAETNPSVIVRAGDVDRDSYPNANRVAFSTDGGSNWFQATSEPGGVSGGGTVAAAADGSRFVWSPDGAAVSYSVGYGNSWATSQGVPTGATVESDRVNPMTFYAFGGGAFYVSTDGGASFTRSAATGLPGSGTVRFAAVPGHEGDIWLAGGATGSDYGLWHSTDSGATFARVSGVDEADNIGFGKAAAGQSYPALYSSAKVAGVRGIFRSDDAGVSWVRINDDDHQYANTGQAITGDPRVYGRVYIGTNGRGIVYGESDGTVPSPTTSTPSPTTSTPSPTASTPSPTASTPSPTTSTPSPTTTTPPATGSCQVAYTVSSQWPDGFLGAIDITNTGTQPVDGWDLVWRFTDGQLVTSMWGATPAQDGAQVTATALGWNAQIAPGGSVSIGFIASWSGANSEPTAFSLNGASCAVA